MISITKLSNNFEIVDCINDTQISKSQLMSLASGYQQLFREAALVKGDRIGLAMQEDSHHLAAVFAAIDFGLIIVISGEHNITNEYISRRNIKTFITRGIQPCKVTATNVNHIEAEVVESNEKYTINHSEILVEALTSGSTGVPKCISHTHESIWSATQESIKQYWQGENTSWFFHNIVHLGVSSVYFFPALFSSKKIILPPLTNCYDKELIEKYKPTIMLIFPSHFESYPGLQYLDLSCVNWVLTGGSTIPIHFVRRLIKNEGVKNVAVIYGLTECLPPVIHKVVNIENLSEYNESEMGYIIDESGEYTVDDEDILTIKGSSHLCQTINDKPVDLFVTQDVVSADGNTFYFEKRNSDLIRIDDSLINPQQLVPYSLNGYCCIFSTSQTHVVVVLHHKDFEVPQLIQKLDDNGITHDKLVTPIELNVLGKPNINKLKGIYDKGN